MSEVAAVAGRSAAKRWGRAARLGREVGEEGSGTARRGPGGRGIGTRGREPEVGEDPADHSGVLDRGDQAHAAATARAGEHIDVEGAAHQGGPRPGARFPGRLALELGDPGRGGVSHEFSQREPWPLIGDGAAAPAGVRGEDPVVEDEVDAGARSQGGELFEELQGFEEQVARAVGPLALQLQQDAAVGRELEAVLGDRGSEQIAAELLEAGAVFCRHGQAHVEIEALEVGAAGPGRGDPGDIRLAPELHDPGPRPPTQRDAPQDRGARDGSQSCRFLSDWIRGRQARIIRLQAVVVEEPADAGADRSEQPGDLLVAGWWGEVEVEAPTLGLGEDPIEHERMEMNIQIQRATEALDDRDTPGLPIADPALARLLALKAQERAHDDTQHGAAEGVIPGEEVAEAVGEAQDPLAYGHSGQHLVHQMGGALGHAPAPAARAEAAALARERHEPLERAGAASNPGKAMGQDAAGEEVPELPLHEVRQAGALGALGRLAKKGLQVVVDDLVEDALLCGPGLVGSGLASRQTR